MVHGHERADKRPSPSQDSNQSKAGSDNVRPHRSAASITIASLIQLPVPASSAVGKKQGGASSADRAGRLDS